MTTSNNHHEAGADPSEVRSEEPARRRRNNGASDAGPGSPPPDPGPERHHADPGDDHDEETGYQQQGNGQPGRRTRPQGAPPASAQPWPTAPPQQPEAAEMPMGLGQASRFRLPRNPWVYIGGVILLILLGMGALTFCDNEEPEPAPAVTVPADTPEPTQDIQALISSAVSNAVLNMPAMQVPVTRVVPVTQVVPADSAPPPQQVPAAAYQPIVSQYTPEHFQLEYVQCFNPGADPETRRSLSWQALLNLSKSAQELWHAYYRDQSCQVPHNTAAQFGEGRVAWLQNAIYGAHVPPAAEPPADQNQGNQ